MRQSILWDTHTNEIDVKVADYWIIVLYLLMGSDICKSDANSCMSVVQLVIRIQILTGYNMCH